MKKHLKEREKRVFATFFLFIGIATFFLGTSISITGAFIGTENTTFSFNKFLGMLFLTTAIALLLFREQHFEAILIPLEENKQKNLHKIKEAIKYYHTSEGNKIIISAGGHNNTYKEQLQEAHKQLIKENIPRGKIEIEEKATNNKEKAHNITTILNKENLQQLTIIAHEEEAKHLRTLLLQEKETGKTPTNLTIRIPKNNIEKTIDKQKKQLHYLQS